MISPGSRAPPTRCCGACSRRTPTPIARCAQRVRAARRPRPRARAAARLRRRAARAHARPRDRDARPAAGAQARPARPRGAAARRLPARLRRRRAALRGRERVGGARRRARLERAVPFTNAVLRRLADGIRAAARRAAGGAAASTPTRTGSGTSGGATWATEEALALMRAQNEPPETVVSARAGRAPAGRTDVPGALAGRTRRRAGARRGPDLAAEPRLAARRPGRGLAGRRARRSTSAPRRAARRRCSPARWSRSR